MRFLIFGVGGVGGFFGATLAKAGLDVWFFARGKHLKAMKAHGLRMRSPQGNFTVPPKKITDDLSKVGTPDVVLLCVKTYDLEAAARQLSPILSENSIIISLENGLDGEEIIKKNINAGTVYGGVAYIYANISAPGVITERNGPKKIAFGPLDGIITKRAEEIHAAMNGAGFNVELSADIKTLLWKKFIFIAAGGGVVTAARLPLADVLAVEESRALFQDAMKEAIAIGRAKGINIEPDLVEKQIENLKKFENSAYTSMYHDLASGKPLEIEALSGAIVRYGRELDIPTPINRAIYATLLPHHILHLQKLSSAKQKTNALKSKRKKK
ncbi:MAG: ketopantoate reductase family protein [Ignavibacteriales bacterium]|nr:ketopantoate reductase family protein [Ignavibacteriales bacterium]